MQRFKIESFQDTRLFWWISQLCNSAKEVTRWSDIIHEADLLSVLLSPFTDAGLVAFAELYLWTYILIKLLTGLTKL